MNNRIKDTIIVLSLLISLITLASSVYMTSYDYGRATYLLIISLWMFSISQSK